MSTTLEGVALGVGRRPAVASSIAVTSVLAAVLGLLTHVAGSAHGTTTTTSSNPTAAAGYAVPRSLLSIPIPRDAVWQSGQNRWAEPAPGAAPSTSSAAAIQYFRDHAFYGQVDGLSSPQVHLWFFTSPIPRIRHRLAWFLTFRNATADLLFAGAGPPAGCVETYVVDATTGLGLDDGLTCNGSR